MVWKPVAHSKHGNSKSAKAKQEWKDLGFTKTVASFFQKTESHKAKAPASVSAPSLSPAGDHPLPKSTAKPTDNPSASDPGVQNPTKLPPELDPCLPEIEETDPNWKGNCDQSVLLTYFGNDAPYADDESDDSDYPGFEEFDQSGSEDEGDSESDCEPAAASKFQGSNSTVTPPPAAKLLHHVAGRQRGILKGDIKICPSQIHGLRWNPKLRQFISVEQQPTHTSGGKTIRRPQDKGWYNLKDCKLEDRAFHTAVKCKLPMGVTEICRSCYDKGCASFRAQTQGTHFLLHPCFFYAFFFRPSF